MKKVNSCFLQAPEYAIRSGFYSIISLRPYVYKAGQLRKKSGIFGKCPAFSFQTTKT
jgi:hypothetical protein